MPVHGNRTLAVGTLRKILRDIEMSPDEFEDRFGRSSLDATLLSSFGPLLFTFVMGLRGVSV